MGSGTNKPSTGDKLKGAPRLALFPRPMLTCPAGTMEMMTGKLTGNHAKVEQGRERKAGDFDAGANSGAGYDSNQGAQY
jgi:hypothetical protein